MILIDHKWTAFLNTPLRADTLTSSAADAFFTDHIPFFLRFCISQRIGLPENGIDAQIEILHLALVDAEHDADVSSIARIDIGQIWLFLKDLVPPFLLLFLRHRIRPAGETDHFLISGIAQNLDSAIL